jgi:glycosyltransferase involved in cell wall biosynthesis
MIKTETSAENGIRVTVIIPTYNCAPYLPRAIESVLHQTYIHHEIIVINDGSTDNTMEVLKDFLPHIRTVEQANQGVSAARNTGIRMAQGEHIAFLDADDAWFPNKLERQVRVLDQHPDCIATFSNFHIITGRGDVRYSNGIIVDYPVFRRENKELPDLFNNLIDGVYTGDLFPMLFLGNFINTCSLLVRKSAVDRCGYFDTSLSTQEDYDYWLRLSRLGRFAYIDQPLLNRTKRENQLTCRHNRHQIIRDVVHVVEKNIPAVTPLLAPRAINQRLRSIYKLLALVNLDEKQNFHARKILFHSLKTTGIKVSTILLFLWTCLPHSLARFLLIQTRLYRRWNLK